MADLCSAFCLSNLRFKMTSIEANLRPQIRASREALDSWVREVVRWHFDPATGSPFWLDYAEGLDWDPRREIQSYADLSRFGFFQDEWLRGGPVRRWVPKAYAERPVYVFETGGSTGVPKSRITSKIFVSTTKRSARRFPLKLSRRARTGSASGRRAHDACGSVSNTSRSIAAASVSWST